MAIEICVASSGLAICATYQPTCPGTTERSSAYFQWKNIDWLSTAAPPLR